MSDLVGTVVASRYVLEKLIGQGGQGVVYRAEDRLEKKPVAVKVLPIAAKNKELSARLAREQEAALALAGTSAVAVYDLCEGPQGALCLVMEFLEGEDLERRLQDLEDRGDRMSLPELSAIAEPLVETLERAHQAGILHRDLKPGNIFLLSESAGGGVRLLDFGLSRMRSAMPLTAAGTILGSPSYIAPEVWKGKTDDLDGRADVYSFGVILYRALAGKLPFPSESLQQKFVEATTARRPSLHALRPDLPKRVDAWVETALAIERENRHQTVRAMWQDLLSSLNYSPAPGVMRPVAQGLVSAWRKAAGAFRRFMEDRGPEPAASPAAAASAADTAPENAPPPAAERAAEAAQRASPSAPTAPAISELVPERPAAPSPTARGEPEDGAKTILWVRPPPAPARAAARLPAVPPPPTPERERAPSASGRSKTPSSPAPRAKTKKSVSSKRASTRPKSGSKKTSTAKRKKG